MQRARTRRGGGAAGGGPARRSSGALQYRYLLGYLFFFNEKVLKYSSSYL